MHKKIAVIKTSADGQKPVSTFASLHFQVFFLVLLTGKD